MEYKLPTSLNDDVALKKRDCMDITSRYLKNTVSWIFSHIHRHQCSIFILAMLNCVGNTILE